MKHFCVLLLFVCKTVFSQDSSNVQEEPVQIQMTKSIIRAGLLLHHDVRPGLALITGYEYELWRTVTLQVKAGPSFSGEVVYYGNNAESREFRFSVRLMACGELRYYYNLGRRSRLHKTIQNYSAGYFSIEPFIISKSFVFINTDGLISKPRISGTFFNIGFQKQAGEIYYNWYLGLGLRRSLYKHGLVSELFRGGIIVGGILD